MSVKNFYPTKQVIPFTKTKVEMGVIIDALKKIDTINEVRRAAYIFVRNETGNGNSVICGTNCGGVQSDSGKWPEKYDALIIGTTIKAESRTGNLRGFVVFNSLQTCLQFICERLEARGIYIGGFAKKFTQMKVVDSDTLAIAYYKDWVIGDNKYTPNEDEVKDFKSMYRQSATIFK